MFIYLGGSKSHRFVGVGGQCNSLRVDIVATLGNRTYKRVEEMVTAHVLAQQHPVVGQVVE